MPEKQQNDTTPNLLNTTQKEMRAVEKGLRGRQMHPKQHKNEMEDKDWARAVQLRLANRSYESIAAQLSRELGREIRPTGTFKATIRNMMRDYVNRVLDHADAVLAQDIARIEAALSAQYELVLAGSDKHLLVMLKAIKAKHEIMFRLLDIRMRKGQVDAATPTLRTDSDEFAVAVQAINEPDTPVYQLLANDDAGQDIVDSTAEILDEKDAEELRKIAMEVNQTAFINEQNQQGGDE